MKMTSEQFLQLEHILVKVLTTCDKALAIKISKDLEKTALSPFYAKKVYSSNFEIRRKYSKLYGFYFSSDFDVNFFKIKYPRIIL